MRKIGLMILALVATTSACNVRKPDAAAPTPVAQTLEEAYLQALALSPLPYEVERDQQVWTGAAVDMRFSEQNYLVSLQARIRQDQKAGAVRTKPEALDTCIDVVMMGCEVTSAGFLSAGDQGRLWWQIQTGFTEEDGVGGGLIVFEETIESELKPILWTFEGAQYETPSLERQGDRDWLLIVPGISRGTGSGDMTVMMLWRDSRWRPVDTNWQSRVGDQLKGMEVWHQPRWAFPRLVASSPLWRPGDAGCCGTGGTADMEFDIIDERLTLIEANISPPPAG